MVQWLWFLMIMAVNLNRRNLPTAGGIYLPQLDGVRAVAVIMVFLHHAYTIHLLWAGVDLFFILSGYLITSILLRDSELVSFSTLLGRFYLRRAQRILPAYVLSLVLTSLLTSQNWAALWPYYAFFLQNIPYAFHLIGFGPLVPLWSLAVEQHFYLLWPFLVFFLPRRALALCLSAILVGVPLGRFLCTPFFSYPEAVYALTPFRIDAMAAGALIALWLPQCGYRQALLCSWVSILFGLIAYAFMSGHPAFRRSANAPLFNAVAYSFNILILGGFIILTLLASPQAIITRVLASGALRALGRVSYSFYLLHLLVLSKLEAFVPSRLVPPIGFVVTMSLATLSWIMIERPLLRANFGRMFSLQR